MRENVGFLGLCMGHLPLGADHGTRVIRGHATTNHSPALRVGLNAEMLVEKLTISMDAIALEDCPSGKQIDESLKGGQK